MRLFDVLISAGVSVDAGLAPAPGRSSVPARRQTIRHGSADRPERRVGARSPDLRWLLRVMGRPKQPEADLGRPSGASLLEPNVTRRPRLLHAWPTALRPSDESMGRRAPWPAHRIAASRGGDLWTPALDSRATLRAGGRSPGGVWRCHRGGRYRIAPPGRSSRAAVVAAPDRS
jgi:hypothetical protein